MKQDLRIKMFDRRQQIQNNSALKSKFNKIPGCLVYRKTILPSTFPPAIFCVDHSTFKSFFFKPTIRKDNILCTKKFFRQIVCNLSWKGGGGCSLSLKFRNE